MRKLSWLAAMVIPVMAMTLPGFLFAHAQAGRLSAKTTRVIRAAERGDPRAETYLGWLYLSGRGVPQHYTLAARWYRCAAQQGDGTAQFALGMLYNKGQGIRKDYLKSYMWLNLSAAQAVGEDRDFKVRIRDSVASKLTRRQLRLAQNLRPRWKAPYCPSPRSSAR